MIVDNRSGNPTGTGPYRKASATAARQGTVYTVAGSSGQVSSQVSGAGPGKHPVMYLQSFTLGSVVLTVEDSVATARFIDNAGAVRDQFQIVQARPVVGVGAKGAPTSKFRRSGRQFRFPSDNSIPFRVYSLEGNVLIKETPLGSWEPGRDLLPDGEYFFRYGSTFGRMSLP